MGIGKRLREAREHAGLSQIELAKRIGVTGSAITNYEKEISHPKESVMYALMDALDVEPNFLFQDCVTTQSVSLSPEEQSYIKKYRLLDPPGKEAVDSILDIEHRRVLDDLKRRQDAHRIEASEEPVGDTIYFMVPEYSLPMSAGAGQLAENEWAEDLQLIKAPPRGTSYVAHVKGDSMEPTYHDGDLLFVHSTREIQPGSVGVFLLEGNHYVKELGKDVLISHNPEYDPIPITEDTQCQGLVLGVCDESYFA